MFGQRPRLDPLESRKAVLISESEINRDHLSLEWESTARELRALGQRAKVVTAWALAAVLLLAGVAALRSSSSGRKVSRLSWLNKVLKGARLGVA